MTRWWVSDHHFSHANIVRFCDRPYRSSAYPYDPDTYYMNTDMVARHNKLVSDDDEVWILGDLALGNTERNLGWASQLNGVKTFVVGNHDKNFRRNGSPRIDWDAKYAEIGQFDSVLHGTVQTTLSNGVSVNVSHFPYVASPYEGDRYLEHRPVDDGHTWLIHGHVHDSWRQQGRQINVGLDAWGGYPISEDTIIALIDAGPNELERMSWD